MEQNHMLRRPAAPSPVAESKQSLLLAERHPEIPSESNSAFPTSNPTAAARFAADRSLKLPSYPPPSYTQSHDPKGLFLPDAPKAELAPIHGLNTMSPHDATRKNESLPSFSTLAAAASARSPSRTSSQPPEPGYTHTRSPDKTSRPSANHWPTMNPLSAYYTPSHAQNADSPMRMDIDSHSSTVASAASPDTLYDGRASSVSLDDPDVRLAAEALGDLKADFVSSPPNRHTPLPASPQTQTAASQPEPLLSLLTTSHPLLATTIEGATSAYNSSKEFSPRFKSGAEYVEGFMTPIASTVGSVSRGIGVEGGVRWWLGGGRARRQQSQSDLETGSNKRRRVGSGASVTTGTAESSLAAAADSSPGPETGSASTSSHNRRLSVVSTTETLPAYDEQRSPPYAETYTPETRPSTGSAAPWQSRLIMSTSGLSIAMSSESLRSLKFCLGWLKWANDHIGKVIGALKDLMDRWENVGGDSSDERNNGDQMQGVEQSTWSESDRALMAARIAELRADVLKTLQNVMTTVSRYAGGALPENARVLVRRHLTSLPQRFRIAAASSSQGSDASLEQSNEAKEKETREGAQRVLVLAKEGLDMMSQVSGVLDGTIASAEEWCERLGRKKREQRQQLTQGSPLPPPQMGSLEDVKI